MFWWLWCTDNACTCDERGRSVGRCRSLDLYWCCSSPSTAGLSARLLPYHKRRLTLAVPRLALQTAPHHTTLHIVTVRRFVPVFNYAPRHGGTILCILILGTRERWWVSLTFRPPYPTRKSPEYLLNRKLSGFSCSCSCSSSSLGRGRGRNFAVVAHLKFPSPAIFSFNPWLCSVSQNVDVVL